MRRLLRWVGILALILIVAGVGLIAYVFVASSRLMARTYPLPTPPAVAVRSDPASLARGKYLVERVAICAECHGEDLGGRVVVDEFARGRLVSANLTRGRGGIGAVRSNEDLVRSIVHGIKPDGHSVIFMPSNDFQTSEEDLGAILGYIRSMPPVDRELPTTAPGPLARALGLMGAFPLAAASMIDHAHVTLAAAPAPGDPAASGAYLVSTAGCRGCHTADFTGGGGPPPGAGNITPIGIGDWTEPQFMTALREHRRPNGTTIDEAMPRLYGQMSDEDLDAIFAFLRTLPPAGAKTVNQNKSR